jgi:alkyl sulfatase BDS1-like metallo-beta-lactamase superfamily hydrolase
MATEILLNDGGAPARILPFTAAETVTAGNLLTVDATGKVQNAISTDTAGQQFAGIGFALTTITSGNIASVITGKGVILNINCKDVDEGVALMMGTTAGEMITATHKEDGPMVQAVCLEDTSAAGLHRAITV